MNGRYEVIKSCEAFIWVIMPCPRWTDEEAIKLKYLGANPDDLPDLIRRPDGTVFDFTGGEWESFDAYRQKQFEWLDEFEEELSIEREKKEEAAAADA